MTTNQPIKGLIFDLDGVITDTAELHCLAWKQLAEEEGLPFTREDNEKLRGVSRRESLLRVLRGRSASEAEMQAMMARKNAYYQALLTRLTPSDLLPGISDLLDRLDAARIPYAIASASRNARTVVEALGLLDRVHVLADGSCVQRQKPAPDLFRYAAARLGYQPHECLVVEDAEAGIEAALVAGMPCLALGPEARFAQLQQAYGAFARRDDLLDLDEIQAVGSLDETWCIVQTGFDPARQHHMETVFTIGNGYFCNRGILEEGYPGEHALTLAHGLFDDMPISFTELVNLPNWLDMALTVDGKTFRLDQGRVLAFRRYLDLRQGILYRAVRWQSPDGVIVDLTLERFASYAEEHLGAMRLLITAVNRACQVEVAVGIDGHVANDDLLHWHHLNQGQAGPGTIWLESQTRHSGIILGAAAAVTTSGQNAIRAAQCPGQPHRQAGVPRYLRELLSRAETGTQQTICLWR